MPSRKKVAVPSKLGMSESYCVTAPDADRRAALKSGNARPRPVEYVRMDRVLTIRKQLAEGTYYVPSVLVAESVLRSGRWYVDSDPEYSA